MRLDFKPSLGWSTFAIVIFVWIINHAGSFCEWGVSHHITWQMLFFAGYLSDSPHEFFVELLEFVMSLVEQGEPPAKVLQTCLPNLFGPAFGIKNHAVSCKLLEYGCLAVYSQHKWASNFIPRLHLCCSYLSWMIQWLCLVYLLLFCLSVIWLYNTNYFMLGVFLYWVCASTEMYLHIASNFPTRANG